MKVIALGIALLLSLPAVGGIKWTSFENADKTKSFSGRLVSFDSRRSLVTVQRRSNLRSVTFRIDLLSEENQEMVKEQADILEAAGGLRMEFFKSMEPVSTERGSENSRTRNYNAGFEIKIRNYATKMLEDVTVEYIAVYRKDAVNSSGTVMTKKGSYSVSFLMPNIDETVVTDTIPMTSFYKPGKVTGRSSAGST